MCPLGAIYGLLNKVSIYHMECNKKTCVSCGKCHNIWQVSTLLRRCSNNLNQYAKRANESGSIYAEDIRDLQKRLDELWEMQKLILKRLSVIR